MNIEYLPLHEIQKWPRNPKDHDIGVITQSFDRFGFIAPLIRDENRNRLVAGHGRLDALAQKFHAGDPAPRNIQVRTDGEWMVPVCGVTFTSETEALAYVIADNQTTILGDWHKNLLAESLQTLKDAPGPSLEGTGFDLDDLDEMLSHLAKKAAPEEEKPAKLIECPNCQHRFKA